MRQRTSYPNPYKTQVVQECLQPGASVASVAMSHGINANVVRKWLPLYRDQKLTDLPAFLPVQLEPNIQNEKAVSIELPCEQGRMTVKWPASDPDRWRGSWQYSVRRSRTVLICSPTAAPIV